MVIDEKLFGMVLKGYVSWTTGPEQLLGFVTLVTNLSAANAVRLGRDPIDTLDFRRQLAGILIREIEVDIRPYRDFDELCSRCILIVNSLRKLDNIISKMKEEIAVCNLVEDTGILPSEETRNAAIAHGLFNREVIEKLRPYITFE